MYYGCKKEIPDDRDYKMKVVGAVNYPNAFELTMPKVKDQGIVNSCVAHSLSTFLEKAYSGKKFSTGFIYGYRPEGYSQDEGMYPREAMKTLLHIGDVLEDKFSHNKEMVEIKNLVDSQFETLKILASNYKIRGYSRIYTESEVKKCIFAGTPVPISIPVRSDLRLNKDYTVSDLTGPIDGYHMIILYGWNEKGFLFQNSWGKDWGNEGKGILPYGYDIDTAWAISTYENTIETYQTIWQRLIELIKKILNTLLKKG